MLFIRAKCKAAEVLCQLKASKANCQNKITGILARSGELVMRSTVAFKNSSGSQLSLFLCVCAYKSTSATLGLQMCVLSNTPPNFTWLFQDLNSDPYACEASVLATEPPLQPKPVHFCFSFTSAKWFHRLMSPGPLYKERPEHCDTPTHGYGNSTTTKNKTAEELNSCNFRMFMGTLHSGQLA